MADIVFDSLLDEPYGEDAAVRRIRFERDAQAVDMIVRTGATGLVLELTVAPAGSYDLEIRQDGPLLSAETDSEGKARLPGVRPGLISVLLRSGPGLVRTAWVRI